MKIFYKYECSPWYAPKLGFSVFEPFQWMDSATDWVLRIDLIWVSLFFTFIPAGGTK
jgi:hypothetical protein